MMQRLFGSSLVTCVLLAASGPGCPASRPMSVPPGEAAFVGEPMVNSSQEGAAAIPEAGGLRADGAGCFSSSHCQSNVCEGASCDASRPGSCVPDERACTDDIVEYCGCDGMTFVTSSSCPGEAFAHRGPCEDSAEDSIEEE